MSWRDDESRQTGRTTRMLKAAIAAAEAGETVLVVVGNTAQRSWMEVCARQLGCSEAARQRMRYETYQVVEDGRLRGVRFGACFEDHFAGEDRARRWQQIHLAPLEGRASPDGSDPHG